MNPSARLSVSRPCPLLLISLLLAGSVFAAESRPRTFCNPLDLPYRFQPDKGNFRSAADPVIVRYRDAYWLFASRSGGYWRSENLLDWTFIAASGYPLEIWAPSVAVVDDKLYLTTGAKAGTFTTADPATGQWTHVTSYDWVVEDPMVLQDDDGRVYLYDGCSNKNPMRVTELDRKTFQPISTTIPTLDADTANHGWEVPGDGNQNLEAKPWIEGSWVNKINGRYYLQYSGPGTQFKTYADGVYVSDRPTGPFVYQPYSPFSFKPGGFITGSGHSATFAGPHGQFWHISCLTISKRHIFERRLGLFPSGVLPDGQLVTNTYLGDYPQFAPGVAPAPLANNSPGWMLVSYAKPARASSTLAATAKQNFEVANAFDEETRTWWSAATGNPGEWIEVDLAKTCRIDAIQLNFADEGAVSTDYLGDHPYRYTVEASDDAQRWTIIVDRSTRGRDAPNDYVPLEQPVRARYLRVTNVAMPAGGRFSLFGLRAFGSGLGTPPPEVREFTVERDAADGRHARVAWAPVPQADFYIVRYGIAADKLFGNYQVYRENSVDIRALNVGTEYFFTVDAVNDTGVTRGTRVAHD